MAKRSTDLGTGESDTIEALIDKVEAKYGSLREAGRALGISHQNLSNWRRSSKRRKFLSSLNAIFDDMDIPESRRGRFLK